MTSNSTIYQRSFGAYYDTALRLGGNEFTQPIAVGEHWTKLRVGLLLTFPFYGAMNMPQAQFTVGMCNTGKSYMSANSAFVGWCWGRANSGTDYTYTENSGNPFYTGGGFDGIVRVGTTNSTATVGSPTIRAPISTQANPHRGVWIYEVTKGTSTFGTGGYAGGLAHMSMDFGMNDLYNALEQASITPVLRDTSMVSLGAQQLAYAEQTYGYLNCVNVWWNRMAYPIEIYGLAVYVIY